MPPIPRRSAPHTGAIRPAGSVDTDALLCAAARGDVAALGSFYDLTASTVYTLLHTVLGDRDQAQQATERVYLRLWRDAPRFDPATGSAIAVLLRLARGELAGHVYALLVTTTDTRGVAGSTIGPVLPERR